MEKKHLFFDLDGTLTDPKEGITKSVQYALSFFGIQVEDRDQLNHFIGPPLKDSFMEDYGFSQEEAFQAILKYREYFSVKGLYENKPYPGIRQALEQLAGAGKKLYVATSKPEVFAKKILAHFGLEDCFSFIGGSDLEQTRGRKADVIRYVLRENGIKDLSQVVMIGDRKHDCLGAKETGVASIGVLYGYGSREELEAAGAGAIVESLGQLVDYLLKGVVK